MEITQSKLIEKNVCGKSQEVPGETWRMKAMVEIYNRCANEGIRKFFNLPGDLGKSTPRWKEP